MRSDDEQVNEIEELREQLAAANKLLARMPMPAVVPDSWGDWLERRRAHLAAHPATAPDRDEAERRVLDAVRHAYNQAMGAPSAVFAAELARRGLK